MSTYAIGDIQGCLQPLQKLLEQIAFDPAHDSLWFVGDLINRGPQSLETLRFIKNLGNNQVSVLGNHDLHLLAVAYGVRPEKKHDTIHDILTAPDRDELTAWLRERPLMHSDETLGYVMTHAGLAPVWTVAEAHARAQEVENILRGQEIMYYLQGMYGNEPDHWDESLTETARFRCIVNYFTRMRYCFADGSLDLEFKGKVADKPVEVMPWYQVPNRKNTEAKIIFGHWAALDGVANTSNIYALDTGCVWGKCLTAMRLEDEKRFSVKCS